MWLQFSGAHTLIRQKCPIFSVRVFYVYNNYINSSFDNDVWLFPEQPLSPLMRNEPQLDQTNTNMPESLLA